MGYIFRRKGVSQKFIFSGKYPKIIRRLLDEFSQRFNDFETRNLELKLFGNPFHCYVEVSNNFQFKLIDLQKDSAAKTKFNIDNILNFYRLFEKQRLSLATISCQENCLVVRFRLHM